MIERLIVEVADARRMVRCTYRGFSTAKVHDTRRMKIHDLPGQGRPTSCGCGAASLWQL